MDTETRPSTLAGLQNLHSRSHLQLLDVVDNLRAQGLSNFLPLPQLIVCGDQSSGKSSVLEAISGVPFPKKDNLCTRFATEVILRRSASTQDTRVDVSIHPGSTRSEEDRTNLENFKHTLTAIDDLPNIISDAKNAMGLGSIGQAFSTDVLRLEVKGPDMPQLTIVDLPGLIHSENRLQTAQDVELAAKLVQSYMQQDRSIILAVISAKNDYANQIVLKKARSVDPDGQRTLGIITKPDTLPPGSGMERNFIDLATNKDINFKLGWHVVRNRDTNSQDVSSNDRDQLEQDFFRSSNWTSVDSALLGVGTLRVRLSKVLFDQIRKELPRLVADIEKSIAVTSLELKRLGRSRTSEDDQRLYLYELTQQYNDLSKAGCNGDYDHTFFGNVMSAEGKQKRLRAVVQNASIAFKHKLTREGSKWRISETSNESEPRVLSREEAVDRVTILLRDSRGKELPGTFNPERIGDLFKEYSEPWRDLAHHHVEAVWRHAKTFVEFILESITDEDVAMTLLRKLVYPELDRMLIHANNKLDEIVDELTRHPITYNNNFTDTVARTEAQRRDRSLAARLRAALKTKGDLLSKSDIEDIIDDEDEPDSEDIERSAAEATLDHMIAYYKVALKRMIDNIPALVLETQIMVDIPALLASSKVARMDHTMLDELVGESPAKQRLRTKLEEKLEVMQNGETTCKRYATFLNQEASREGHDDDADSSADRPYDQDNDTPETPSRD